MNDPGFSEPDQPWTPHGGDRCEDDSSTKDPFADDDFESEQLVSAAALIQRRTPQTFDGELRDQEQIEQETNEQETNEQETDEQEPSDQYILETQSRRDTPQVIVIAECDFVEPESPNADSETTTPEITPREPPAAEPVAPEFGLLEVIEAFTAMRHEFRNQTREQRPLVDSVGTAAASLNRIESTLDEKLVKLEQGARPQALLEIIIELDISLNRAVNAVSEQVSAAENQHRELAVAVKSLFEQSGFLSRKFAQPFYHGVLEAIGSASRPQPHATADGIRLLQLRLRRMMVDKGIERVETLGKPFDAETMQAIASIATDTVPPGCIAEELSPAYFYLGGLVRFAEVKVATVLT